jgi:hypothetical protein
MNRCQPIALRRIALAEIERRLPDYRRAAADRLPGWSPEVANRKAALWVAIALAAGVGRDLPFDVCKAIEIECLWPHGHKYLPTADRFCREWRIPWAEALAELADARDRIRTRAEGSEDLSLIQRAIDLTVLAEALGAPPVTQDYTRKEAA